MNEDRLRLAAGVREALARITGTVNEKCVKIGCSPPTLYRWRSGATAPSAAAIARLARLADMTQDEIKAGGRDA